MHLGPVPSGAIVVAFLPAILRLCKSLGSEPFTVIAISVPVSADANLPVVGKDHTQYRMRQFLVLWDFLRS